MKLLAVSIAAILMLALASAAPTVAAPITLIPGFNSSTAVSGLTDPRGLVAFPPLNGFPRDRIFIVEQSLNRVSMASFGATPTAFATGLSAPLDLQTPSPPIFGLFLYVTEPSANRISRIDGAGAVTTFATFTSAPKRMAFSPGASNVGIIPSAFGNFLFVSLEDGRIVKVDPAGTVSPCVSGLSGPEGLVFGPGGSSFKTILYVAESTANRLSKVTPNCTVSPFASTGLSAPTSLEISPGGGFGPIDTTLYVVNAAGTRIDRVDKNGNVTAFASGFMQAHTFRSDTTIPLTERSGAGNRMVTDVQAGTITSVNINFPFAFSQLTGCNPCKAGDTFAVTLTVENQSPINLPVELKTAFRLVDSTPVNVSPLGNKHFETTLPPGFHFQGPWLSFPMPLVPPGLYCYDVSLADPEVLGVGGLPAYARHRTCFTVLP